MQPADSRFDRAARAYLRLSGVVVKAIAVVSLAAMVAINAAEIVYRAMFARGLNWVQELSLIIAMTLYFLVYALVAKDRDYIRIAVVSRLLGDEMRHRLAIAIRLIVLAFQATLAWYAVRTTAFSSIFTTSVLGWSEVVFYAPLAVGCADIVVTELVYLVWQLRRVEPEESERVAVLT